MNPITAGTQTQDSQAMLTPSEALFRLKEGNRRFVEGRPMDRPWLAQVEATSTGQFPAAVVLGCIDSRVPVETIFDQGIGDIFTARVAGNVVNDDLLGSMEFACRLAGSKAVVVLGHTSCGAVQGAIANARLGNLTSLVQKIDPAVEATRKNVDSNDPGFADRVAEAHVGLALESIRAQSSVLREMEAEGDVALVGAMYDVASGEVRFL